MCITHGHATRWTSLFIPPPVAGTAHVPRLLSEHRLLSIEFGKVSEAVADVKFLGKVLLVVVDGCPATQLLLSIGISPTESILSILFPAEIVLSSSMSLRKSTVTVLNPVAGVVYTDGLTPRCSFSLKRWANTSAFWATMYVDTGNSVLLWSTLGWREGFGGAKGSSRDPLDPKYFLKNNMKTAQSFNFVQGGPI